MKSFCNHTGARVRTDSQCCLPSWHSQRIRFESFRTLPEGNEMAYLHFSRFNAESTNVHVVRRRQSHEQVSNRSQLCCAIAVHKGSRLVRTGCVRCSDTPSVRFCDDLDF